MESGKWIVTGLLIAFVVLSACEEDECGEPCVWVGVKVDDDDYYACTVYTQLQHMPKDLLCETVETPVNGGYEITTVSDDVTNNTQHIILYHCDRGYELVGHSNRTCNGTSKQWTNEEPHCEPTYINQFKQKWKTTEDKFNNIGNKVAHIINKVADVDNKTSIIANKVADIDNKMSTTTKKVTDIDNKMTTAKTLADIEDQLTAYASTLKNIDQRISVSLTSIEMKLTTLETKQTTVDNRLAMIEKWTSMVFLASDFDAAKHRLSKAGELATVGFKDGSLVSQFTWMVENFEEEITKAKGNSGYYVKSKEFYTHVPGYRAQLLLYPNIRNSGYVGVYLMLLSGEFDDTVPWPFNSKYEFISVSRVGSQIAQGVTNPPEPGCPDAFKRPTNNPGCGNAEYIKSETLLTDKDQYLHDGGFSIKFTCTISN